MAFSLVVDVSCILVPLISTAALAVSLPFNYALASSLSTVLFHSLLPLLELTVGKKVWLQLSWLIKLLILALFQFALPWYIPAIFLDFYALLLQCSGVILVLLEAVHAVIISVTVSRRLQTQLDDPNREFMAKVTILSLSASCYALAGYVFYLAFSSEYLTLALCSYLTVLTVLLIVGTIASVASPYGLMSDVAMLSLFLALSARLTLLAFASVPASSLFWEAASESSGIFEFFGGVLQASVDLMIELGLALALIFYLSTQTSSAEDDEDDEERSFLSYAQLLLTSRSLLILGWTRALGLAMQQVTPVGGLWRAAQCVIVFSLYSLLCWREQDEGFLHLD